MSTVDALEAIGRRATAELRQARRDHRVRVESADGVESVGERGSPADDASELCGDLLDRVMTPVELAPAAFRGVGSPR